MIEAKLGASGDGQVQGPQGLSYHIEGKQESATLKLGPIDLDNHDGVTDVANISFDDFLYHLNTFQIQVNANLEFGGILSPLPDLPSLTLLQITLDVGANSPFRLPQHNGTQPLTVPVFVENYALSLDAKPADDDPARVDENTLSIKPGEFGKFRIYPKNLGSVTDTVDNFLYSLSNRPNQTAPFTYFINLNTDFDCRDSSGGRFRG